MKHKLILLAFSFAIFFTSYSQSTDQDISKIENGLLKPISVKGETPKTYNILDRMKVHNVPGVSIAIVKDGSIQWAKGYGIANTNTSQKVDANTLFQAGSISKPIAALGALKLVDQGKIDLDVDVNSYLKNWTIPDSKFTKNEKVTLRRLLTHTAGMTVHGFPGYTQKDNFPPIEKVLNGKGNTGKIEVDTIPGAIWRYSGGGYTVMEKIVEDVSELSLEEFLKKNVLSTIEMDNSTYDQPLTESFKTNASAAYYGDGSIIEGLWHNYPEQAAAGLWTTPTDLAKYIIEIQEIVSGKKDGVLSKEMTSKMLTKDKNNWGLGPSLRWENDSLMFGHGGKNAGFTNQLGAFVHKGAGFVIMTNADNGGRLIGELMRGISKHYDWGISNVKEVDVIKMENDELTKFEGKYKLDFQVPNIGDYFIDVTVKDGKLVVFDPNNNDTNILTPQPDLNFIDLNKGDNVKINFKDINNIEIVWKNQYHFNKVSK